MEDAQNNENPIVEPSAFTNTIPYSQQIHLRVESNETTASSNWHHYAMVFGSDENYTYENIKFYIDGQEVLVGCGHNWTNSQSYVFPDDNFLVGQSSTFYSNFSGSIDDIAIWNKALSAEDINNYSALRVSLYVLQRILELDCKKILLDIGRSVEILMTSPEIIMDPFLGLN